MKYPSILVSKEYLKKMAKKKAKDATTKQWIATSEIAAVSVAEDIEAWQTFKNLEGLLDTNHNSSKHKPSTKSCEGNYKEVQNQSNNKIIRKFSKMGIDNIEILFDSQVDSCPDPLT